MASPGYIASCCLGNKSVFINSDIPSSHALLQERAVSGVGLTFGILSIVGLFVVLYPWRCTRKQSLQRVSQHLQGPNLSHVVHCIIAAGIIGNIGIIVRSCVWLDGSYPGPEDTDYRDIKHSLCIITSVWVQYCFLAEVFWHLCYGLEAYMISHGTTSSRWLLHIIGWTCPALFTALGAWVAYHPSLRNCGAQKPLYMGVLYLLILVPVVVVFLINLIIFYKASSSVKKSLVHHFGKFSTEERRIVDNIQLKFILFSLAYLVCWTPNLLNGIFVNVLDGRSGTGSIILVFLVLEAVLNPCEVLLLVMVTWGWPSTTWCTFQKSCGYQQIRDGNVNAPRRRSSSRSRLFLQRSRESEKDPLLSFSRNQSL